MRHTIDSRGVAAMDRDASVRQQCDAYADEMLRRAKRAALKNYHTGAFHRSLHKWTRPGHRIVIFVGSNNYAAGFVEWGMGPLQAQHTLLEAAKKTGFKLKAVKFTH